MFDVSQKVVNWTTGTYLEQGGTAMAYRHVLTEIANCKNDFVVLELVRRKKWQVGSSVEHSTVLMIDRNHETLNFIKENISSVISNLALSSNRKM